MAEPSKQLVEAVFKGLWAANLSNYSREYIENLSITLATELANLSGGGSGGGLENIVEDLTPQLGGDLDSSQATIFNVARISFNTTSGESIKSFEWEEDFDTAILYQDGGTTHGHLLQETQYQIKNDSGDSFRAGDLVMFNGADGNSGHLLAIPFQIEKNEDSKNILGIVKSSLEPGEFGKALKFGTVKGLNTTGASVSENWQDSDILWANQSIPGKLTNVVPTNGFNLPVAIVLKAGPNGSLLIRVPDSNIVGVLNDLEDVEIDPARLSEKALLSYSQGQKKFVVDNTGFSGDIDTGLGTITVQNGIITSFT